MLFPARTHDTHDTMEVQMGWIIGAIVVAVVGGLIAWCCGAVAGRCDDGIEEAREREAAKHAVDVAWWRLMADAALDAAREGEC